MRILIVEDTYDMAEALEALLTKHNYVVDIAESINMAKAALHDYQYDIILLDRMLPDGDGLELINYCKRNKSFSRFVVLSALDQIGQKVEGLDLGADDYLTKPFDPEELLARLRVSLRHGIKKNSGILKAGAVSYEIENRTFSLNNKVLVLPRREALMLEILIKRFERVVARETIESNMYSFDDEIASNTIEAHISRLRKKLVSLGTGLAIKTARGVGYRLVVDKNA